jgi:hypothetical protein
MSNAYKEKNNRHVYFRVKKTINWDKFRLQGSLKTRSDAHYSIIFCDQANRWEINLPAVNSRLNAVEYQTLEAFTGGAASSYLCYDVYALASKPEYPYQSFKDALKACKELRDIYAHLPIIVHARSGDEGVTIGESDAEEIAAVLTYG